MCRRRDQALEPASRTTGTGAPVNSRRSASNGAAIRVSGPGPGLPGAGPVACWNRRWPVGVKVALTPKVATTRCSAVVSDTAFRRCPSDDSSANSSARAPGSTWGFSQTATSETAPADSTASGAPPAAGTRSRPPMPPITIRSSSPQLPPRAGTSALSVTGAPPPTGAFFSAHEYTMRSCRPAGPGAAKKPIHSPSGEKNGSSAPLRAGQRLRVKLVHPARHQLPGAAVAADVDQRRAVRRDRERRAARHRGRQRERDALDAGRPR